MHSVQCILQRIRKSTCHFFLFQTWVQNLALSTALPTWLLRFYTLWKTPHSTVRLSSSRPFYITLLSQRLMFVKTLLISLHFEEVIGISIYQFEKELPFVNDSVIFHLQSHSQSSTSRGILQRCMRRKQRTHRLRTIIRQSHKVLSYMGFERSTH